jgi:hypothetical protein
MKKKKTEIFYKWNEKKLFVRKKQKAPLFKKMSTPSTNWAYTSTPQNTYGGKAVQALTIAHATVGTLHQTSAPMITVPANLYYFKAYGGNSTDGGNIADFTVADPASSSAFSLATKKYTAPVSGLYRFAAVCYSADSNMHASLRRVRGEENITLQYIGIVPTYGEANGFSLETFLEAGDEVFLYCDDGRLRLADYNAEAFTLSSLTSSPRTTFEGRLVYQTA